MDFMYPFRSNLGKKYPVFNRIDWYDVAFVILLLAAFLVRLDVYSTPFELGGGDTARDYIISSEIISFDKLPPSKLPLFGPGNGLGLINSPLYFYMNSFFLLFHNSFFFMNLINIVFQIVTIGLIYYLMRNIFGGAPALMTSLLFSFDSLIMRQSLFMWQPWVMQPFLYASYLALYIAWKRGGNGFLNAAVVLVVIAGALHNSAFTILPTILFLAWCVLRKRGAVKKDYLKLLAVLFGSFLIVYLPSMVLAVNSYLNSSQFVEDTISKFGLGVNLSASSFAGIYKVFSLTQWQSLPGWVFQWKYLLVFFVALLIFHKRFRKDIVFLLIAAWISLQPFLFLSVLLGPGPYKTHYVALVVGVFYMFLSGLIYKFLSLFNRVGKIVFVVLIALIAIRYAPLQIDSLRSDFAYAKDSEIHLVEATDSMVGELRRLQAKGGFDDLNFFYILGMKNTRSGPGGFDPAMFWLLLEERLDQDFVYAHKGGGYDSANEITHAFLVCIPNTNVGEYDFYDCRDDYAKRDPKFRRAHENPLYRFPKQIYSGGVITVFVNEEPFSDIDVE